MRHLPQRERERTSVGRGEVDSVQTFFEAIYHHTHNTVPPPTKHTNNHIIKKKEGKVKLLMKVSGNVHPRCIFYFVRFQINSIKLVKTHSTAAAYNPSTEKREREKHPSVRPYCSSSSTPGTAALPTITITPLHPSIHRFQACPETTSPPVAHRVHCACLMAEASDTVRVRHYAQEDAGPFPCLLC